ncbi:hypothetical protein [Pseudochryseolinea flava]|uniref:Uncharacterized protein n=1 Tax=Pseudochryseolinea flava TaxID=2059302 RepID=A0A364Y2B3_9BACT|nr:hypothetical protein [Pseudochryseolinea flava]RAW00100.1 hypothetical protein DQQ10_16250 [Pseudochryseolinea flava]
MRLGQLARKLAIPPSDITDFLATQGAAPLEGANTRLSDEQLSIVLQRFAPNGFNETNINIDDTLLSQPSESPQENFSNHHEDQSEEIISNAPAPMSADEPLAVVTETTATSDSDVESEGKIETIKAQKVSLSGLKVLGKIELPEPKKKVQEVQPEDSEASSEDKPTENNRPPYEKKRPHHFKKDRREQRPTKNPVALAREREARAAEDKRKEDEKRRKELRTLNYQKRVKPAAPTKAARLIDEDVVGMSSADLKPEPKTWLGKFWRWFTT